MKSHMFSVCEPGDIINGMVSQRELETTLDLANEEIEELKLFLYKTMKERDEAQLKYQGLVSENLILRQKINEFEANFPQLSQQKVLDIQLLQTLLQQSQSQCPPPQLNSIDIPPVTVPSSSTSTPQMLPHQESCVSAIIGGTKNNGCGGGLNKKRSLEQINKEPNKQRKKKRNFKIYLRDHHF